MAGSGSACQSLFTGLRDADSSLRQLHKQQKLQLGVEGLRNARGDPGGGILSWCVAERPQSYPDPPPCHLAFAPTQATDAYKGQRSRRLRVSDTQLAKGDAAVVPPISSFQASRHPFLCASRLHSNTQRSWMPTMAGNYDVSRSNAVRCSYADDSSQQQPRRLRATTAAMATGSASDDLCGDDSGCYGEQGHGKWVGSVLLLV
ncbi:hypothetical protein BDZ97DRAFT_1761581 [Flammula alnicola]|nr:hypothetical protein BDZ97DRAFT_1761581 [Flammula alnicola]